MSDHADRRDKAVDMRIMGENYAEIADACGYESSQAAQDDVSEGLRERHRHRNSPEGRADRWQTIEAAQGLMDGENVSAGDRSKLERSMKKLRKIRELDTDKAQ